MIKQSFECPNCGKIITHSGDPGNQITISCPFCGITGKASFKKSISSEDVAIEVSNLKKTYDDLVAVNDISFSVKKGEIFAFLGPNGAGKTTTVEIVESIREPTQGQIKLFGKNIATSFNEIKEKIGILPKEFQSFGLLTVRETLVYFLRL